MTFRIFMWVVMFGYQRQPGNVGDGCMKKTKRGSLTAEAAIILPFVMIIIMVVIRLCIVHYQNVVVSAEGMRVASRVAMYWQEIGNEKPAVFQETDTAKNWIHDGSFREHDPYASLTEGFNSSVTVRKKMNQAKTYAAKVMGKVPSLLGEDTEVEGVKVSREQGILQNNILVTVTRKNENPLGYLYEKLGLTSQENFKVTSKAVQADTTELIRNISLLYDFSQGEFSEISE